MSHSIILGHGHGGGGGLRTAEESTVTSEIRWTPPHDMPPRAERKRIEKAENMLSELEAVLSAPIEAGE